VWVKCGSWWRTTGVVDRVVLTCLSVIFDVWRVRESGRVGFEVFEV
jgi:hypothetical protein